MARRPRVEFEGAFYHVIVRGNQRQKIFADDRDRIKYLEIVAQLKQVHGFRLYAFVLMANHVHLLLESGEVALSRVMQRLASGYTQYYNRRHGLVGHLFQGRYKAILCDRDSYLLELSRYLHLNPVRAKVVRDPAQYRWSSYGGYVRHGKQPQWLDTGVVLGQFSRKESEARKLYRAFVRAAIGEGHREEYYEVLDGRFLGDRAFAQEVKAQAESSGDVRIKIRAEAYLRVACAALEKKREDVRGAGKERERVRAREALCYVGRTYTELSVTSLAAALAVDATCVSRSVARAESRIARDKALRNDVDRIVRLLENRKYQA